MQNDVNEPAFPVTLDAERAVYCGMSLRDYFAGQALAGMCGSIKYLPSSEPDHVVRSAYKLADLMLDARKAKWPA